ncbi:MAG: flagellar biosynthetic protein FliO [Syntrophomonadaceae bacterium]|jgi:flagellar protein FliO/FliZ|nr:flagellar biosynthetic protein FliO [Syntrophomonadaceae bacterium]
MGDLFEAVLRLLIFLPLVAALAYFSLKYGLGKKWQFQGTGSIKVLDRVSLNAKSQLYLVEAGGKYFVLASGEQGAQLITELSGWRPPDPVPTTAGTGWRLWGGR